MGRTSGARVFLVTFSRPLWAGLTYAAPPALDWRACTTLRLFVKAAAVPHKHQTHSIPNTSYVTLGWLLRSAFLSTSKRIAALNRPFLVV